MQPLILALAILLTPLTSEGAPPGASNGPPPATRPPAARSAELAHRTPLGGGSITVALASATPRAGAHAVLLRRKALQPQNVVLVTDKATPVELAAALAAAAHFHAKDGGRIAHDMQIEIPRPKSTSAGRHARVSAASGYLRQVARAPLRSVAGIGRLRAIDITF
jgi:hypothetical protein